MMSSECDKLRRTAYDLDMIANAIRSGVPARTWHGMTYVFDDGALLMRRAADTILELRNKFAGTVDQSERIAELESENAKLRKLARGLNWCTENAKVPSVECEYCPLGDTFFECGELSCEKLMRELRIEV